MIYISFDIGIKNLAYCVYDDFESFTDIYHIYDWNIINLIENPIKKCCKCNKKSKYTPSYCGVHCPKEYYKLKNIHYKCKTKQGLLNIFKEYIEHLKKHNQFKEFIQWMKTYENPLWTSEDIQQIENDSTIWLQKQYKNQLQFLWKLILDLSLFCIKPIQQRKVKSYSIQEIGISLNKELTKLYNKLSSQSWWNTSNITILIEHQLSYNAVRMTMIQSMITQWFICRNMNHIEFVNSSLKLSKDILQRFHSIDTDISTYTKRKKTSIECVYNIPIQQYWKQFFDKHKKKDDLADCLLQCISYIYKNIVY